MSRRGRLLVFRPIAVVVGVLVVAGVLLWLVWLRDPPPAAGEAAFELPAGVEQVRDHARRTELRLTLQLLASEMQAGRRSADLRKGYRMVEERLDPVLVRASNDEAARLESEEEGLLLALSRQRMAAFERIGNLLAELRSWAGPGRQGGRGGSG